MPSCCSRRRCLLTLLVSVLVAMLVLAACGGDETPSGGTSPITVPASGVTGAPPPVAQQLDDLRAIDFSKDPKGEEFRFVAPRRGLLLVYFGYLSCPDICPLTMVDTANGVRGLGADAARIEVAFVTVDPERDKPDNLRNYLTHFFPDGHAHGVQATNDTTLLNLTYRFGASFKIDPHTPGTNYGVAHTGNTYVVDAEGRLVWVWPFGTNGQQITATLRTLLPTAAA
jgi:protein SCO1/2